MHCTESPWRCKTEYNCDIHTTPELQNTMQLPHLITIETSSTLRGAPWRCKTQCNCDIQGSISSALKRPVQCAELRFRAIDPPNPARGFIQQNQMCVWLQRRAIKNFDMYVSQQRRTLKIKLYEICVSLQFRAIDPPNPARGFLQQNQNARLATAACIQKFGNVRFTTATYAKLYKKCQRHPQQLAT